MALQASIIPKHSKPHVKGALHGTDPFMFYAGSPWPWVLNLSEEKINVQRLADGNNSSYHAAALTEADAKPSLSKLSAV